MLRVVICRYSPDWFRNVGGTKLDAGLHLGSGAALKTVWYGAELLGNLIGAGSEREPIAPPREMTRAQSIASIRADYDEKYFVTGEGKMEAYALDCRFADPFASFNGLERFKRNVSNLGSLMEDVKLDISQFEAPESASAPITTKWRFSCILNLPWRPRLAAAGGTTHVLDPQTNLVVDHIEEWDVEPAQVVRTLLKPSTVPPTNSWERGMLALHDGDLRGFWWEASGPAVGIGFVGMILASAARAGAPGAISPGEAFWGILTAAGLATVAYKQRPTK